MAPTSRYRYPERDLLDLKVASDLFDDNNDGYAAEKALLSSRATSVLYPNDALATYGSLADDDYKKRISNSFQDLEQQKLAAGTKYSELTFEEGKLGEENDIEKAVTQALLAFVPMIGGYMLGGNELAGYGAAVGVGAVNKFEDTQNFNDAMKEKKVKEGKERAAKEYEIATKRQGELLEKVEKGQEYEKRRGDKVEDSVKTAVMKERLGVGPKGTTIINEFGKPDLSKDEEANRAVNLAGKAARAKQALIAGLPEEAKKGFIDPETREINYGRLAGATAEQLKGYVFGAGSSAVKEALVGTEDLADAFLRSRTGAAAPKEEAEKVTSFLTGGGLLATDIPTVLRLLDRFYEDQRNTYGTRARFIQQMKTEGADPSSGFDYITGASSVQAGAPEETPRQRLNRLRATQGGSK